MGSDEDGDEGGEFRLPLPPQDRLWRHPSEMRALAAAGTISPNMNQDRRTWGVAVASAFGGALVVGALWLAIGFDPQIIRVTNHVASQPLTTEPPRVITVDEWARELEAAARPAAVGVATAADSSVTVSGFTYLDDGHVLTTAGQLDAAAGDEVSVELSDGTRAGGSVIGVDPVTDLAVVSIAASATLPVATTAEHPELQVGDGVVVVGHQSAVMANVVSFDHAMRDTEGQLRFEVFGLEGSFTPDLVGSPVVDSGGAVIGLITVIHPEHAYAIAADTAREVADQLIENGAVAHQGWVGLSLADVDADTIAPFADQPYVPSPLLGAVEVRSVVADSPGETFAVGEWIIFVDEVSVTSRDDLRLYVSGLEPGTTIDVLTLGAPLQNLDGSAVRTPAIHSIEVGARPPSDR